MESRDKLFKQYKSDCPQTIGETDTAFDNDNFIDWLFQQNKAQLDEINELKSKLILSEQKVKLNYNCIIDLQSELKDKERFNEQKDKEIKKLEFMIENGLNYNDLQNDIDKFPQ